MKAQEGKYLELVKLIVNKDKIGNSMFKKVYANGRAWILSQYENKRYLTMSGITTEYKYAKGQYKKGLFSKAKVVIGDFGFIDEQAECKKNEILCVFGVTEAFGNDPSVFTKPERESIKDSRARIFEHNAIGDKGTQYGVLKGYDWIYDVLPTTTKCADGYSMLLGRLTGYGIVDLNAVDTMIVKHDLSILDYYDVPQGYTCLYEGDYDQLKKAGIIDSGKFHLMKVNEVYTLQNALGAHLVVSFLRYSSEIAIPITLASNITLKHFRITDLNTDLNLHEMYYCKLDTVEENDPSYFKAYNNSIQIKLTKHEKDA